MSRRLGVSAPLPTDATGVCFHFTLSGSLPDRSTVSTPDSSDDRNLGLLEDHGHVRFKHHAPDSANDPPADVTLVPVEVMDEGLVADRQRKRATPEAECRSSRDDECMFHACYWLCRGIVLVITVVFLINGTFSFCEGGNARPELSVWEVAWRTGGVHSYLHVGLEDLQRRGECEVATVNGVRVLYTSLVHAQVQLPARVDAWGIKGLSLHWADWFGGAWFAVCSFLTILSAIDLCGRISIWWGSGLVRLFVPFAVTVVPYVREALIGQWLFLAVGLAVGSWAFTTYVGGTAELVLANVFSAVWVVIVQYLLQALVTAPFTDEWSTVGRTRRWVRRMRSAALTSDERREVLLYAEAAGMSQRFRRRFPAPTLM
jgi:hypothetical protein